MTYQKDCPELRDFAKWLVTKVTETEKRMVGTAFRLHNEHRWAVWSMIAENHMNEYARHTNGTVVLRRSDAFEAAGDTITAMLNAGEIHLKQFTGKCQEHALRQPTQMADCDENQE